VDGTVVVVRTAGIINSRPFPNCAKYPRGKLGPEAVLVNRAMPFPQKLARHGLALLVWNDTTKAATLTLIAHVSSYAANGKRMVFE